MGQLGRASLREKGLMLVLLAVFVFGSCGALEKVRDASKTYQELKRIYDENKDDVKVIVELTAELLGVLKGEVEKLDRNGDGKISLQELLAILDGKKD